MATIVRRTAKDGTPSFLARVRRKGAPPLSATFPTRRDAQKWIHVTEGAVIEGRHFPTPESKRHTVGDMIARYLTDILPRKRYSTRRVQVRQLQWWDHQLGHHILADVTPAHIVACRDTLARGERENATVVRYLAALSHAFTVASREWNWCDDNPVRRVTRPREPRGRVRFLSDEERTRVLDACRASRNPHLYTVVVLALSTGARRGELLSLRWGDVDLQRGIITLQDTKNGERRTLHVTGAAHDLLRTLVPSSRMATQYVFPDTTGTKPAYIRTAWDRAVRRAGVRDFRFHDLRHSAASYLAMSGASLLDIGAILGHRSYEMTRRYAHLSDTHTRGVVERMTRSVFGS